MQKDLLYCAIDVSKDRLDVDGAALALPAQLGNDHASFRQLIKAAKKYPGAVQFVFESHRALPSGAGPGALGSPNPSERSQSGPGALLCQGPGQSQNRSARQAGHWGFCSKLPAPTDAGT